MKITTHYLKSLIIEAILKEYPEYFGKEFIAFKNRYEKGEDSLLVAQSMLKEIGSGSTRKVFEFSDNSTAVLKVINTGVRSRADWESRPGGYPEDHPLRRVPGRDFDPDEDIHGFTTKDKLLSNQWESDLTMQQLYPDVFPRTFEIAKDYSWILSERVKPLKTFQELLNAINLEDETFSQGNRGAIQFQAIIEAAILVLDPKDNEVKKLVSEAILGEASDLALAPTLKMTPAKKRKPARKNIFKSRIIKVLSDPHTRKILRAMGDLDIPVREFSAKNLGISEISGKLMLLDASLWKEYKPVTEAVEMNRHQLRSLIMLEKKKRKGRRKHPRYRPPKKDPKTGKYDNPCGPGFAPGAQSGVKTKIGPQSGRRVSNCEKTGGKKNEQSVYDYQRDPYLFGKVDNPYDESELYKMQHMREGDPPTGTGKKPKGSSRRLYTDEDPSDTVSVEFKTAAAIKRTLAKKSFKSKSHNRQSQIINLIHQRARAAYRNAKDPKTKARLKRAYEYAKQRKEASKQKTARLRNKK